ncbi:MAG: carbohydrate-binding family 9-like protein [Candidatus Marinimicrobia bacterium]|nr:carbohydrate-binding family 9-like protein [Candidatus Neomarinimicrobiota bacterium]
MKKESPLNILPTLFGCAALGVAGTSLAATADTPDPRPQPPVQIRRTQEAITLDGKLDEPAWQQAPAQDLEWLDDTVNLPPLTQQAVKAVPFEPGRARFLLGPEFLYIGIEFEDADVVAQLAEDQAHLYRTGDLAEVFIKAAGSPSYWELYVSPLGNKTSFFFPSPGYLGLPDCFSLPLMEGFDVAAAVDGTVNDYRDTDRGWTAEMAIPLDALKHSTGVAFAPGEAWRILVARYNYGRTLRTKQHSSYPLLPLISYHLIEYYAPVQFLDAD